MCQSLKGAESLALKAAILFLLLLFEQSDDSHCHIKAAAAEGDDSAVIDAPAPAVVTVGCVGLLLLSPPTAPDTVTRQKCSGEVVQPEFHLSFSEKIVCGFEGKPRHGAGGGEGVDYPAASSADDEDGEAVTLAVTGGRGVGSNTSEECAGKSFFAQSAVVALLLHQTCHGLHW